jgi:hypothetical protein
MLVPLSLTLALISGAPPTPQAPQVPIAAGPYVSLPHVLAAAQKCGIDDFRIQTSDASLLTGFQLFLLEDTSTGAERCLIHWETRNGRRLKLKPRWWKDDLTRDEPPRSNVRQPHPSRTSAASACRLGRTRSASRPGGNTGSGPRAVPS